MLLYELIKLFFQALETLVIFMIRNVPLSICEGIFWCLGVPIKFLKSFFSHLNLMNIKLKPTSRWERPIISKFLKNAPNYRDTHQGDKAKWLVGVFRSAQQGIEGLLISQWICQSTLLLCNKKNYEVCAVKVIFSELLGFNFTVFNWRNLSFLLLHWN